MGKATPFPAGMTNANWFGLFNAVSFQIFLGPPIILYAKSLGASSTVLGVLASLTPLLTIFQIPAAHYIQRIGYRRFMLAGWGMRNLCVFLCTVVPLLPFVGNGWKLVLLLGFQFFFNLLRGIVSGAWFPWITELLPEQIRARFLSRDMRFNQVGSLVALLTSALVLGDKPNDWRFAIAFLLSAIGGAVSLYFLNRVPDQVAPERLKQSGTPVPWGALVSYAPFTRLVGFNVLSVFTTGSLGVFTIAFLKGKLGIGENQILLYLCVSFTAALASLHGAGQLLEQIGSKGVLRLTLALHLVFVAGWVALSAALLAPSPTLIVTMYLVSGVAGAAMNIANSRLAMSVIPEMGRSHFFAFFSVFTSLTLGLSPILWGVCLDAMNALHRVASGFEWNRYSVYFASIFLLNVALWFAVGGLREKRNQSGGEHPA